MDTELLIYFSVASDINFNIFPLSFSFIFERFLQGNTDIIILSLVVVK